MLLSFNRTTVECKHTFLTLKTNLLLAFNRTTVECKLQI